MNKKFAILLLLLSALVIAGCARLGGAGDDAGDCPEPAPQTALLENEQLGYCFLYPDEYIVEPRDTGDILVIDSIMNHSDPRFDVAVTDAAGQTVAQAADELIAELPAGMEAPRSTITLDGEEAVVVDNVPFQEISRVVFVISDDRLYRLSFSPLGIDDGERAERAENLYTVVTNSFQFLPVE